MLGDIWLMVLLFYFSIPVESVLQKSQGFGEPALSSEFPFLGVLVKLNSLNEDASPVPICAALLLDSRIAITSSTCFCKFNLLIGDAPFVYFGLDSEDLKQAKVKMEVVDVDLRGADDCHLFPLPERADTRKKPDMAILKLKRKIQSSSAVKYIELASIEDSARLYTHLTFAWPTSSQGIPNMFSISPIRLFKAEARQTLRDSYKTFFAGNLSMGGELTKEYLNFLGEPAICLKDKRYVLLGFMTRPVNITDMTNRNLIDKRLFDKFQYTRINGELLYAEGPDFFFGKTLKQPSKGLKSKLAELWG